MSEIKTKIIQGVFWRSLDRFGTQIIGFVISVILARLLGPEEYGMVALLTIFLVVSNVFINSGFWIALVQKKNADELDFNSIFYFNICMAFIIYALLWIMAPCIANFYHKPILVTILRISALNLVISSFNGVQDAILTREMRFHLSFLIGLFGSVTQGVIGILLAYYGYGLWALVFASLGTSITIMVAKWGLIGWRPRLIFSYTRVKSLFNFGSKILCSELLETFFNQLYCLIIGKRYTPADLAFFNKGESIPSVVMSSVQGVIGSVAFPAMSKVQNDRAQIRAIMKRMMTISSFLIFPAMCGLAVIAKPLVILIFTDKWLDSVPYLQLACISYAVYPIHVANLQVIQACGRSDIFLRLEIIKKIVAVVVICATFKYGVLALAIGRASIGPVCSLINAMPCNKLIGYPFWEQFMDLFKSVFAAMISCLMVYSLTFMGLNNWLLIICQVGAGMLIYLFISYILKNDALLYLIAHLVRK